MLVNELKIGQWKHFKSKNKWELRIEETKLLVGIVYIGQETVDVYACFHDPYNTYTESISLPIHDYEKYIHSEWKCCMNKLLNKMFL